MADTGAKATETALNPEAKSFVLRNANEVEPFKPPDVGSIHWGKVISVHPFGAFVRLDTFAKDGLCHVSQLTHPVGGKRIEAREVVSEGQRIVCKVIDRSWSKMRFFLSAKWVDQESGADLDPDMANHLAEVQAAKAAPREDAARAEDAGKAKPRPDKPAAGRREAGAGESAAGKSDQKAPAPDSGRAQKPGEKASGAGGGDGPQQLTISHKVCKALVKQLKSETTARPAAVVVSKIASLLRTLRQPDPTRAGRKAAGDAREAGAAKGDGAAARGAGEWERSSAKGKGTRGGAAGTGGPVTVQQEYYATALASLVETGLCKQLVRAVRREALGNTVEALAEAIRDCSGDGLLRDALGDAGACEELAAQLGPGGPKEERARLAIVQAVRSLAINNHANRERLRAAGAVGPLTAILGQRSLAGGRGLAAAAQALRDMCCENDANRAAFLEAGAAPALVAALTEKPGGSAALDPPAAAGTEAKGSKDQDGAKPEGPDAAAGAAGAAGAADAAGAAGGGAGGPAGRAAGRDWLRAVPVLQAVRMLAYGEARGREALAAAGACEALAALLRQHPLPPSYRPAPAQPLRLRPAPRPPSPLTGPAPRPRDCPRDRVPRPPRKPAPAKLGAREAQGAAQCASSITATAQAVSYMCYNSDANRARFEGAGALERLRALQRESLPEETREAVQAAIRLMQLKGGAGAGGGNVGGNGGGDGARG